MKFEEVNESEMKDIFRDNMSCQGFLGYFLFGQVDYSIMQVNYRKAVNN